MKLLKSLFIALTFTVLSFAGQMTIKTTAGDFKTNLATVDSIVYIKDVQPNTIDSLYIKLIGENLVTPMSTIPLRGIYDIKFTPYQNSDDESITIYVGSGVLKGDYKILLKDIESLDFTGVMDDVNDTDGDGLTDVYELFYSGTNHQLKDTDGDGIDDKDDPNPTVPDNPINNNEVDPFLGYNLYDSNGEKIGYTKEHLGSLAVAIDRIPNTPVTVEVLMSTAVKSVAASLEGSSIDVIKVDDKTFRFKIPALTVAKDTEVLVTTTSVKGSIFKNALVLSIPINFSNELQIEPSFDLKSLYVGFVPSTIDERITGYAILRASGSKNTNNKALENLSLTTSDKPLKELLPEGVTIVAEIGNEAVSAHLSPDNPKFAMYQEYLGSESSYYTYRVVAYVKEKIDGKDVYSYKLTNTDTKGTGKVRVYYKLSKFGTQYMHYVCQADMRIFADIRKSSQSRPVNDADYKYNYWFYNAGGSKDSGILWETKADRNKNNLNVVNMNENVYSIDLNHDENVDIYMRTDADCGVSINESTTKGTSFLYSGFVQSVQIRDLPESEWPEYTFTYGKGGVEVNPPNNNCGGGCGDKPHAGWKFKMYFRWIQ